jgi:polyhydroxybutyrate depolymerase
VVCSTIALVLVLVIAGCTAGATDARDTATTRASTTATTSTTVFDPAAIAARPSAGCGVAGAAPAGEVKVTIASGGAQRWYVRHVPPAHDGVHPVPLVVDLHGYSEGADVEVLMSQLGAFGDTHGFATITPEGSGTVPQWDTSAGSADQAFVADAIDDAERTLCIDLARVFVAGLSNGAMMASALACTMGDRVAAVAAVAGITAHEGCAPARPVPVVTFHGTEDPFISFGGGYGAAVADLPAGDGRTLGELASSTSTTGPTPDLPPIPDVVAAWAARNGCGPRAATTSVAADVARISYPCPPDADVDFYRIDGGGHAWPGSAFSAAISNIVGSTTMAIDANTILWDFFVAHPLAPTRN